MSWAALGGTLALLVSLTSPAAAAPSCPGHEVPSPPAASEEVVPVSPLPLPRPVEPVGGAALGACGDVGPAAPPTVTTASYLVADLDTGAVLAARAPHARQRPASTLKILTSLVVLRKLDPETVVDGIASDLAIDGSKVGVGPGGRYTVRQLLQGLLLNSGNDAAEALARALGGDPAALAAMTAAAHDLGALDTRPATPSGLDGPGMATSAYDLALILRAAMREPLFAATTATRSVPFPGYGDRPGFVVSNTDRFVPNYPGAIAGKAGFTEASRHTLVVAAQRGGRRLVVVLMRGEQRPVPMWRQAAALMDQGFAQPAGAPGIGTLVDGPPAPSPTPTAPASSAAAEPQPASDPIAAEPSTSDGSARYLIVGAGVVAGALIVAGVRRRRRR